MRSTVEGMLKDIAPKARAGTTRNARKLRRKMTLPEVILWHSLRQRPAGLKFRRQHPTGPYVLDFFCTDARLAIEVDGEAHSFADRPQRDEARDEWLRSAGIEAFPFRLPISSTMRTPRFATLSLKPSRVCPSTTLRVVPLP